MAYGLKYRLHAETVKYKDDVKIYILEEDFIGTEEDKFLGGGGVTMTKDNAGVICGTSLSFSIQADSDFEYLSFFESDPRKYLVQLLINESVVWQGYLIGDEYREAFRDPPYDVAVVATDGLGLLKNYPYTVVSTPTTKTTRIDVIREVLENTGLELQISVAYNATTTGGTHLFEVSFSDDYYQGWTCYEVLEKMIPPDATITQHGGMWLIRRNEQDSETAPKNYDYVEGLGYIVTDGDAETPLALAPMGAGDVYPIGQAELNMQHAWSSMELFSEHGKRPSFCYNHDFSDGLNHWEESTPTGNVTVWKADQGSYVKIAGEHAVNAEDVTDVWVKQSFPYTAVDGEGFLLEFKYCAIGYVVLLLGGGKTGKKATNVTIKGRIEFTNGGTTWYLDEKDGWSTTNKNFEHKQLGTLAGLTWTDFKIYADRPPLSSGTMTVYLYGLIEEDYKTLEGVMFTDVVIHPIAWSDYPDSYRYDVSMKSGATERQAVTILPTSAPDIANYDRMFYNGQTHGGTRVDAFVSGGNTYTFANLILNSMVFLHGATRQLLQGYFRGAGLSLNSVISCAATGGRKYVVESGAWEILNDKFNLNLLEIPGTVSGSTWVMGTTDFATAAEWSNNTTNGSSSSETIFSGGGGNYSVGGGSWLDSYFELVNGGTTGEYIRALRDFASTGEITAYNASDTTGSNMWDAMPVATTGTLGGVIIGSGLAITELGVLSATGTGSTTGTIDVVDGILDLAVTTGVLSVSPYPAKITPDPGYAYLYGGTSNPTFTNRLNLDGILYVTRLYCGIVNTTLDTYLTLNELYFRNGSKIVTIKNGTDFNISTNGTRLGLDSVDGIVLNYFGTGNFTGTVAQILGVTSSGVLVELSPTTYLTAITKQMVEAVLTGTITSHNHSGVYQPSDSDLTAIAALTGTGIAKRTGVNTWALDSSTYLTAITKDMIEAVLTGAITSHTHDYEGSISKTTGYLTWNGTAWAWKNETYALSSHNHDSLYEPKLIKSTGYLRWTGSTWEFKNETYLTAITKALVEAVLTGTITSHNHSGVYEPAITKSLGLLYWNGTAWAFDTNSYALASHNHSGVYQPLDADLTAIAGQTGTGFLKRTAKNTWGMAANGANLDSINQDLATDDDVHFNSVDVEDLEVGEIIDGILQTGYGANILRYSSEFENALWTKSNCTATDNSVDSPFSGSTVKGCFMTVDSSNPLFQQAVGNTNTGNHTFSIWLRSSGGNETVILKVYSNAQSHSGISVTVTSTWQRFSVTNNLSTAHTTKYVRVEWSTQDIEVWGAQLEIGSSVGRYTHTESIVGGGSGAHIYDNLRVAGNLYASDIRAEGNIVATGEVTAYSDARLKHDITPTSPALDKLRKIEVVDYKMNGDRQERRRTGVIAQQILPIFPQMVEGNESDYYTVNYPKLVTVAIKAIQELTEKVERLEKILKENGITQD